MKKILLCNLGILFSLGLFAQNLKGFPPPDTNYFSFREGTQLIEINHLQFFECLDLKYSRMNQIPYPDSIKPLGNEYFIRDSTGKILQSFNSNLNWNTLEKLLHTPQYCNRPNHCRFISFYNWNRESQKSCSLYYSVYDLSIQDYETSKTTSYKQGFIDTLGTIFIPIEYSNCKVIYSCLLAQKEDFWGAIDMHTGNEIISFKYDSIAIEQFAIYFFKQQKCKMMYVFDDQKCIEIPTNTTIFNLSSGIFIQKNKHKEIVFNARTKQPILPATMQYVSPFYHPRYGNTTVLKVKSNGKYGIYDQFGNEIFPCIYDQIYEWRSEGNNFYLKVKISGKISEIKVLY